MPSYFHSRLQAIQSSGAVFFILVRLQMETFADFKEVPAHFIKDT